MCVVVLAGRVARASRLLCGMYLTQTVKQWVDPLLMALSQGQPLGLQGRSIV